MCVQVRGHGYMLQPESRNYKGRGGVLTYTPQGGNGRGVFCEQFGPVETLSVTSSNILSASSVNTVAC